mgnify:CR=1 FL=1
MYDVCIVGGGINGASAALQCSQKGYSVILFEQKSLGCGASSKTSKLAHGGLRYLENLEFKLVQESLQERNLLIKEYPDLVKPLPFVFPIYKGTSTLKMWLGMKLYDRFSRGSPMPPSKKIDIEELKINAPWIDISNIKSCFLYYDAIMDDKGIVVRVANKARDNDAEIFSEEPVTNMSQESDKVIVRTNKRTIECKHVLNLTGAWNKKLTNPTKGIHIITDKLKSKSASILINPNDKRVFFTIPYNGQTLIGTTDEPYHGDPGKVRVTDSDREYLIDAINSFSITKLTKSDIVKEYAGVRPLAKSKGASRDFVIEEDGRIVSMVGGKFTTHRAMVEKLICHL